MDPTERPTALHLLSHPCLIDGEDAYELCLAPSLPPSFPPSLDPSLSPSLPPSLPLSISPSIPPSLLLSLDPSLLHPSQLATMSSTSLTTLRRKRRNNLKKRRRNPSKQLPRPSPSRSRSLPHSRPVQVPRPPVLSSVPPRTAEWVPASTRQPQRSRTRATFHTR